MREAREAVESLAGLLSESGTGWFFAAERPTEFDCAVFAYTYLMVEYLGSSENTEWQGGGEGQRRDGEWLGEMVRGAGGGTLEKHRVRMLSLGWGDVKAG